MRCDYFRCTMKSALCLEYQARKPPPGCWIMERVGKKAAGRTLDGQEYLEVPQYD